MWANYAASAHRSPASSCRLRCCCTRIALRFVCWARSNPRGGFPQMAGSVPSANGSGGAIDASVPVRGGLRPRSVPRRRSTIVRFKPGSRGGRWHPSRRWAHGASVRLAQQTYGHGNRSEGQRRARDFMARPGRLRALVPGLLFVAFIGAFVAAGAAAKTRSLLPTLACVAAVLATLVALAARTLIADRYARHPLQPPRHVALHRVSGPSSSVRSGRMSKARGTLRRELQSEPAVEGRELLDAPGRATAP